MLPAIRLSVSDRTCCAWHVTFAFLFPKDHSAVVAQASCRWRHRTSCPVFQTPQATYPLLKIQQVRRPLSHRQDVGATTTIASGRGKPAIPQFAPTASDAGIAQGCTRGFG